MERCGSREVQMSVNLGAIRARARARARRSGRGRKTRMTGVANTDPLRQKLKASGSVWLRAR
eukprot:6214616-Pleurochrysis_carterae.AAC.3